MPDVIRLDDIDRMIVQLLQQDGRLSNRDVARRVGVSEGTVRIRLKRLESHGLFKLVVLREPLAFGFDCFSFVRFAFKPSTASEAAGIIIAISQFVIVSVMMSKFNLFSVAVTRDRRELERIIDTRIKTIEGYIDCDILQECETVRFDYHWTI